jgi:hypothetical protein
MLIGHLLSSAQRRRAGTVPFEAEAMSHVQVTQSGLDAASFLRSSSVKSSECIVRELSSTV